MSLPVKLMTGFGREESHCFLDHASKLQLEKRADPGLENGVEIEGQTGIPQRRGECAAIVSIIAPSRTANWFLISYLFTIKHQRKLQCIIFCKHSVDS